MVTKNRSFAGINQSMVTLVNLKVYLSTSSISYQMHNRFFLTSLKWEQSSVFFSHMLRMTRRQGDPWSLIRMDDGQLYCAVLTVRGMEDVRCTETLEAIHPRVLTMQCAVSPATQGSSRSPITWMMHNSGVFKECIVGIIEINLNWNKEKFFFEKV